MNPADTLKILGEINRFKADHPKAVAFAASLARDGVREGTVLELKVTGPDNEEKVCNFRVNERDVALLSLLREMGNNTPR